MIIQSLAKRCALFGRHQIRTNEHLIALQSNQIEPKLQTDRKDFIPGAKDMHRPYRNVAVFLLSWTGRFEDRNFAPHKRGLGNILRDTFGYTIVDRVLRNGIPQPKIQVQNFLADFMLEHDNDDTLLLFYYSGWGFRDNGVKGHPLIFGYVNNQSPSSICIANFLLISLIRNKNSG